MFLLKIENHIATLTLSKISKKNCISGDDFKSLQQLLTKSSQNKDIRCMIINADGDHFTSGLDLKTLKSQILEEHETPAKKALYIQDFLSQWQSTFTLFEKLHFPTISCINGYCIGLGIDLVSATDIRLCTSDSKFSVAEVNVGLAADVGTLQRFPKIVGNQSLVRELCMTGRFFSGKEASDMGFCSGLFTDKLKMVQHANILAKTIAEKEPLAIRGTKKYLVEALDNSVESGLHSMSIWNSVMLQNSKL
eukprot:NODE_324_length_9702_cov_1.027491.p4 type:complete len:250 gc:universal NODE_324_length_9702_cov_1.027491:8127-7378(-)